MLCLPVSVISKNLYQINSHYHQLIQAEERLIKYNAMNLYLS